MLTLLSLAVWLFAVVIAITVHEFAHAWMAERLGDPTARLSDRLTLNPLKHYDPVGTTLLLFTSFTYMVTGVGIPFGWAKPVPFDPYNLKDPRRDGGLIAIAGPISNFIMAIIASLLLRFVFLEQPLLNPIFTTIITLNISLAIFNLIPIHPLDGGKILMALLPKDLAIEYDAIMRRFGMFILLMLIIPFGGQAGIGALISPIILTILSVLLP
jgi:Zn-dependent protease